ncbi:glycosyl-4,4'-diaponeurosporenoate acyltransferase [Rossellomorea aquimaris]|uniref:Glycosyl-4,4'-diaponeurosporenoate acyltransferase n=1 Tax=Rossellomorea aquimaris TaxID=189382 RepID=A0A5D4TI80_9BACI|nr:glycosyl-4,4'-diaponeurosporenoate acyltransferase [Rossellomorea aquimaris]TYS75553.1 glycosyl-4,4'-diaponeurosporenoate acyltransferase [Rossellomorea aquimaris]
MLVTLPFWWTLLINIVVWPVIHLSFSYICLHLDSRYFTNDSWLYQEKRWESAGKFYEKLGIKRWKTILPDGGGVFAGGFRKKKLVDRNSDYFETFIVETRRAEFTHMILIPPALLFFIWNTALVGWIMVAYAVIANIPFVIIQRYNRFRFQRILQQRKQRRNLLDRQGEGETQYHRKEKNRAY